MFEARVVRDGGEDLAMGFEERGVLVGDWTGFRGADFEVEEPVVLFALESVWWESSTP